MVEAFSFLLVVFIVAVVIGFIADFVIEDSGLFVFLIVVLFGLYLLFFVETPECYTTNLPLPPTAIRCE